VGYKFLTNQSHPNPACSPHTRKKTALCAEVQGQNSQNDLREKFLRSHVGILTSNCSAAKNFFWEKTMKKDVFCEGNL
jgi:hypothetical protein